MTKGHLYRAATSAFVVLVAAAQTGCNEKKSASSGPGSLDGPDLCQEQLAETCGLKEQEAAGLRTARDEALAQGDLLSAIQKQVEIDRLLGHLELFRSGVDAPDSRHAEIDQTHQYMQAFVSDDALRSTPEGACAETAELCTNLRTDIDAMQRDYRVYLGHHGEQAVVDRRAKINYKLALLSAYQESVGEKTVEMLDLANRVLTGIVDRLTIGSSVGYVLPRPTGCPAKEKDQCKKLESKIASLRNQLKEAQSAGNETLVNELSLELNHVTEVLLLLKDGYESGSAEVAAAQSRYERLRTFVSSDRPAYREEEVHEVKKVTDKFGHLYIGETDWQTVEVQGKKPWAGYWYPFRHTEMFDGDDAPLKKFDELLSKLNRRAGSADWERVKYERGRPWESSDGMCDAWAVAASQVAEPLKSVDFHGVRFEPKHIKGLLVQKYSTMPKERFGIPYQGRLATDGLAQDLRPEAFHQLALKMLGNNEIPAVDTDPDFEMWNKPLYKYEWKVSKDEDMANAFLVEAKAYYVKWRSAPSNDPTNYTPGRTSDLTIPAYKYRLVVNPSDRDSDGRARVIYGEWILDDIHTEYPDTVFRVTPEHEVSPRNPVIAENLDLLNELISQRR